ncbi:MAG: 3',5'-cyclic-AMP phosphodiesterase, partial [Gammaproteobacteria bacterium]|nr:3',5'-cyclic-AMP phosphodiesterase [Gammaproteobacteria bacterium]
HVHQVHEARVDDIAVYTTPSTCMQFLPAAAAFAEDTGVAPGYRWLELADSGALTTGVVRVPAALPAAASSA